MGVDSAGGEGTGGLSGDMRTRGRRIFKNQLSGLELEALRTDVAVEDGLFVVLLSIIPIVAVVR